MYGMHRPILWYPSILDLTGVGRPGRGLVISGDGVDEIVLDPQNSNTIWMQWGGNLYKSTNKGRAFTLTDFPNQSYPHMNNGDTRTQGPFMAVDPMVFEYHLRFDPCARPLSHHQRGELYANDELRRRIAVASPISAAK